MVLFLELASRMWSSESSSSDSNDVLHIMFCLSNACMKINEKQFGANWKMIHGTAAFANFPCKQGLLCAVMAFAVYNC